MGKLIAILYGAASYVVFLIAFLYAIGFSGNLLVPKGIDDGVGGALVPSIVINVLLLGLFAVQHSIMARPAFKRAWTKFVPKSVERSTYVLFASLILLLLYWQWRPITTPVWDTTNTIGEPILLAVFAIGWLVVFLSTFMLGHFDLFGLKQVFDNWQNKTADAPQFKSPGFYKLVRHPIMTGFIIAFWATPVMSLGHLLFAVVTTVYIVIAIQIEEHDLVKMLGIAYVEYRKRVPALIPFTKFGGGGATPKDTTPKEMASEPGE